LAVCRSGALEETRCSPTPRSTCAGAGALVNSRLDRVLGEGEIIRFIDAVEKGEIAKLREGTLYSDRTADGLLLPSQVTTPEQARFYVALAGELLAEIFGLDSPYHEFLLEEVEEFERRGGLTAT
jgi:hypothetical protein